MSIRNAFVSPFLQTKKIITTQTHTRTAHTHSQIHWYFICRQCLEGKEEIHSNLLSINFGRQTDENGDDDVDDNDDDNIFIPCQQNNNRSRNWHVCPMLFSVVIYFFFAAVRVYVSCLLCFYACLPEFQNILLSINGFFFLREEQRYIVCP